VLDKTNGAFLTSYGTRTDPKSVIKQQI